MDEIWIEKGWFVQRLWTGKGAVVIRSGYVAFLPTEKIKHLGAAIAKGVVLSAAGLVEIQRGKPVPVERWLEECRSSDPEGFDRYVESVLEATGGMKWLPANSAVQIKRVPLRRKKRLWFICGEQSIRLSRVFGTEELQKAEALVRAWPRV